MEYLTKNNEGKYELIFQKWRDDDIEIPEGANFKTELYFWKSMDSSEHNWGTGWFGNGDNSIKLKDYLYEKGVDIVWQREKVEVEDSINQPSHYTSGGIECLDAMQAMLSKDEFIGFLRGNVFKYNWRYKLKNGIEDLKKAKFYQDKLIEVESK